MDSEINYSKLTVNELKILIDADDLNALDELNKRVKAGAIRSKKYTNWEAGEIITKNLRAKLNSEIDYTKLTVRELKYLIGSDPKADKEFNRRVSIGEIKLRRIKLEDIRKIYGIDKAS
ncbi:MAG: hypothetical protein A3B68_03125 [Candidatus Melainabacteria bacterium RIFCSPHIGHO2_02_FULL_34_12]|nr:MAG: hypothetical protein A3B68_03125 [Candidatus Melainabacteria bacterium RIFCSPHIGHO2_02_FULL_34_12]